MNTFNITQNSTLTINSGNFYRTVVDGECNFEIRGQDYREAQKTNMGKEMFDYSNTVLRFCASEYSTMLPVADKIIAGELGADDEIHYTDRMLHCLGYPKMSELLHKCCESIIDRNPGFAVLLLDDEHEMLEGNEAPLSDELRRKYELHRSPKAQQKNSPDQ